MKSSSARLSGWRGSSESESSSGKMELLPWHPFVLDRKERFLILVGGRRSGKSDLIIKWLLREILNHPRRGQGWLTMLSYRQCKEVLWDRVIWEAKAWPFPIYRGKSDTELRLDLPNDKKLYLKGLDKIDPNAVRGRGLLALGMSEAAFCPSEPYEKVLRPMISDTKARVMFESSPNGKNWIYNMARLGGLKVHGSPSLKDANYWYGRIGTPDAGTVEPEEIEMMRKEMSPEDFDQEVMGNFGGYTGRTIPEFYDKAWPLGNILKVEKWAEMQESMQDLILVRGFDWGIASQTVCLWAKVDAYGRAIFHREYAVQGKNLQELCMDIRAKTGDEKVLFTCADPHLWDRDWNLNTLEAQARLLGFPLRKSDNNFDESVTKIRQMCTEMVIQGDPYSPMPRIMVVEGTCPVLVSQFKRLENQHPERAGSGVIGRQMCDAFDAARYIISTNVRGVKVVNLEPDPLPPGVRVLDWRKGGGGSRKYHPVTGVLLH